MQRQSDLERSCAAMMHLPMGLDELQALAEKRMTVESIVYSLGNGFGKLRGAKNGGLQKTLQWRNIILSTGEMPLIRENSMDGVGSRVLELYGRPIADETTARELHQVSERNYGHAGKRYIEYLTEENSFGRGRTGKTCIGKCRTVCARNTKRTVRMNRGYTSTTLPFCAWATIFPACQCSH